MLCSCLLVASRGALPERSSSPKSHKAASRSITRARSFSPVPHEVPLETSLALRPSLVMAPARSRQDTEGRSFNERRTSCSSSRHLRGWESAASNTLKEKVDDTFEGYASTADTDIASDEASLPSEKSLTSCDFEKPFEVPDFSGKWKFSKIEGNFEALMIDAGVSWATRKMAKSANYGIGLATHAIEQNGSDLTINVHNGFLGTTMRLKVDGKEQECIGEDGAHVLAVPSWEGRALRLQGKTKQGHKNIQLTRRYLSGDKMVVETTTSKGEKVLRFFSRM